MRHSLLTVTTSAFLLAGGLSLAQAQTSSDDTMQQGQGMMGQQGQQGQRMMQQGQQGKKGYGRHRDRYSDTRRHPGMGYGMGQGMMGQGMMGQGMMGQGMMGMGHGPMMQVVFAIMDANGDGSLSLEEVQAAHARIFAHMDADKDGQVTKAEIKAFFRGGKYHGGWGRTDGSDDMDDAGETDETDE